MHGFSSWSMQDRCRECWLAKRARCEASGGTSECYKKYPTMRAAGREPSGLFTAERTQNLRFRITGGLAPSRLHCAPTPRFRMILKEPTRSLEPRANSPARNCREAGTANWARRYFARLRHEVAGNREGDRRRLPGPGHCRDTDRATWRCSVAAVRCPAVAKTDRCRNQSRPETARPPPASSVSTSWLPPF